MRWIGLAALALLGCSGDPPETAVVIRLEAEASLVARIRQVSIRVTGDRAVGGDPSASLDERFDVSESSWPLITAIAPKDGEPGRSFTYLAVARGEGELELGRIQVAADFLDGERVDLVLRFTEACATIACAPHESCEPRDGVSECVDARRDLGSPPPDAGVDGGTRDADVPLDTGTRDAGPRDSGFDPCDQDGDGWLEPGCLADGGTADCDDADPDVYPGAPAVCGDGAINDCALRDDDLTRLLGTDVSVGRRVDTDLTALGPGSTRDYGVALSPPGPGATPLLAILAPQDTAPGARIALLELGSPALHEVELGVSCLPDRATEGSITALGPRRFGVTGARDAEAGEPWHQTAQIDATSVTAPVIAADLCLISPQARPVLTATTLAVPGAGGLEAVAGIHARAGGTPCLAVGASTCALLAGTTPTGYAAGLGGMIVAAVVDGTTTALQTRYASGATATFMSGLPERPTGRLAAAHEGTQAIVVFPENGTLVAVTRFCADPGCEALDPRLASRRLVTGGIPDTAGAAGLSIAPFADGRFLYASRRPFNLRGISLDVFPPPSPPTVPYVFDPMLNFPSVTLHDLAIRSVRDRDRQLFVVVALTGPEGSVAPDTLHHLSIHACVAP